MSFIISGKFSGITSSKISSPSSLYSLSEILIKQMLELSLTSYFETFMFPSSCLSVIIFLSDLSVH